MTSPFRARLLGATCPSWCPAWRSETYPITYEYNVPYPPAPGHEVPGNRAQRRAAYRRRSR